MSRLSALAGRLSGRLHVSSGVRSSRHSLVLQRLEARLLLSGVGPQQETLDFGATPPVFVQNEGQFREDVDFALLGSGRQVFAGASGLTFHVADPEGELDPVLIEASFPGSNSVAPRGKNPQQGTVNFYFGDEADWRERVRTFGAVFYDDLYEGVDLVAGGDLAELKYEFLVEPGANPAQIALAYGGADGLSIDEEGNLHIATAFGELIDAAPVVYQDIDGERLFVPASYELAEDGVVRFRLEGRYDATETLVIDPFIKWLGTIYSASWSFGSDEELIATCTAPDGSIVMAGTTGGADWPVTGGAYDQTHNGGVDIWFTKISTDGALLWSTYWGGTVDDLLQDAEIDGAGNISFTGNSDGAVPLLNPVTEGSSTGFVAQLGPDGGLNWSTRLGQWIVDLDLSPSDDVVVLGSCETGPFGEHDVWNLPDIPEEYPDAWKMDYWFGRLSSGGVYRESTMVEYWSSGIETATNVAVNGSGMAFAIFNYESSGANDLPEGGFDDNYEGGWEEEGLIRAYNLGSTDEVWSSYCGGSGDDRIQDAMCDASGNLVLVGYTRSDNFPLAGGYDMTRNEQDGFFVRVSSGGSLLYSTFVGGEDDETVYGVGQDAAGNILLVGNSNSADLPVGDAFHDELVASFAGEPFIAKLTPMGQPNYISFIHGNTWHGGRGVDVDADAEGNIFVGGSGVYLPNVGTIGAEAHFMCKISEVVREWNVMVYWNGDNNLERYAIIDLNKMENVDVTTLSEDEVAVLMQIDRIPGFDATNNLKDSGGTGGDWTDTRRGWVRYDGDETAFATPMDSIGESNMGTAEDLIDFVNWAMASVPAENYALVIGDHGGGMKGLSFDETPKDHIEMYELKQALASLPHIDVLVHDLCLMQMAEVLTQVHGEVDYVVGAEEVMSGNVAFGSRINFEGWVGWLANNKDATPEQFARQVFTYDNNPVTSVVEMSAVPALADAIDAFADTLLAQATPVQWTSLGQVRDITKHYKWDIYRDLKHFADTVAFNPGLFNPAIVNAANAMGAAVSSAVLEHKGPDSWGISTYLPPAGGGVLNMYNPAELDFCDENHPLGTSWRGVVYNMQGLNVPEDVQIDPGANAAAAHPVGGAAPGVGEVIVNVLDSVVGAAADADWFSFSAGAGQEFNAWGTGSPADGLAPELTLYGPDGVTVLATDDASAGGTALLDGVVLASAGTYYVAVSGDESTTGAYSLYMRYGDAAAQQPSLSLATTSADFSEAPIGERTELPFVLTNNGGGELTVTGFDVAAGSPFEANTSFLPVPFVIGPGESVDFGIAVTPTAEGAVVGSVTVQSDDPSQPSIVVATQAVGVQPALEVVLGDGAAGKAVFTDADGDTVAVAFKGGTATLKLEGDSLVAEDGKTVVVTGGAALLSEVRLTGTNAKSALKFAAKGGDGIVQVGDITGDGPMGQVAGKTLDLTGAGINMTGAGFVAKVQAHDVTNGADIIMAGDPGAKGTTIQVNELGAGSDVTVAGGVKKLQAMAWGGSGLNATWAASIDIKGDSGADLVVTGVDAKGYSVGKLGVAGEFTAANVTLAGPAKAMQFGSVDGTVFDVQGSDTKGMAIGALQVKAGGLSGTIDTIGGMKKVSVAGGDVQADFDVAGDLLALAVKGAKGGPGGNIMDSNFDVSGTMKKVALTGNFRDSDLSAGCLGQLAAKGWIEQWAPGHEIWAARGPIKLADSSGKFTLNEGEEMLFFGGLRAYCGVG